MFGVLIFISIICILAVLKSLRIYKKFKLPGPKPVPIVGNMFHLSRDSNGINGWRKSRPCTHLFYI